jgi:hypothetical protein
LSTKNKEVPELNNEMNAIIDQCKDDSFDYNIFIVSLFNPSLPPDPLPDLAGTMLFNQRYGFVFQPSSRILAHELGHGFGGLSHESADKKNVMSYSPDGWRLREYQWGKCNPEPPPSQP